MSQATRSLARDLAAHVRVLAMSGVDELAPGLTLPGDLGGMTETAPVAAGSSSAQEAADSPSARVAADSPSARVAADSPSVRVAADSPSARVAADSPSVQVAAAAPAAATALDLGGLRAELGNCERCRLSQARTQIVFGSGNPKARILFVGEGPGRDEDLQGEPFVGRAGALLTDIIEKGMKIPRSEVYICNVVKCRPPNNRNPEPDEVAACAPFLAQQIAIIEPEVIVALGKFAAQTLLSSATPITRLRGQWQEYRGVPLMPTFHPAHLLRNPGFKRQVWEDIKQVMQRLEMP